jgi:MscS family membrane protein
MPTSLVRSRVHLLVAFFAIAFFARGAAAAPEEPDGEAPHPDSPQAVVTDFLALGDNGRFEEAARYLDLGRTDPAAGAELARRLHAVVLRLSSTSPELLSGAAAGDTDDGLPRGVERIGWVGGDDASGSGPAADAVPVLLQRRTRGEPPWVFSRKTVENVDAWYASLRDRWLIDSLPEPLLRTGWGGLAYWQWLALPLVLTLAWLAGLVLSRLTRRAIRPLFARMADDSETLLLKRFAGPLTMAWMLALCRVALPVLSLLPRADELIRDVLGAALVLFVFWAALRAVDLFADMFARSSWATARAGTRALVPLGARILKVVVGALAIVAVFAKLDYPIASLLAGLGIGGLAVALAAQKSFENLIGAFAIGADQPFHEGDFVRVEDFVATVESIGLRSTRFRTLDRTIVTIPNGKLADMRLETFAARDRFRLHATLGVEYGATEPQIRGIVESMRAYLRAHPKIWTESMLVAFVGFGESALNIEVMAWFSTGTFDDFVPVREEVLLAFMGIVEAEGAAFAFPTRTLHVVGTATPTIARPQ